MNYTKPLSSGSKPLSIGALDGLKHRQQHSCFQYVTEHPESSPEPHPSGSAKSVQLFPPGLTAMGQIPPSLNHTAVGGVPVRVKDCEGTTG